ncbi:DUF1937 family protein [Haematobacter massiliensis]|mgnify:CR=1 FL=1|uniref:DUF1937 family protein n=1 Tax=Haematobacter massiliensis TaxID=195105 RepID=UPI0023EFEAA1|nr:DUF1937 family protein [Haematobacter massiliensis]
MTLPAAPDWPQLRARADEFFGLMNFDYTPDRLAARSGGRLLYLVTPAVHEAVGDDGRPDRLRAGVFVALAGRAMDDLAGAGVSAVSPVALAGGLRIARAGAAQWDAWCRPIRRAAHGVVVPPVLGWQASGGVWADVRRALSGNRPVFVLA